MPPHASVHIKCNIESASSRPCFGRKLPHCRSPDLGKRLKTKKIWAKRGQIWAKLRELLGACRRGNWAVAFLAVGLTGACCGQVYLQRLPQLVGKTFGELQFYLPWATVYGLVQYATRRCVLNPPPDTRVETLDELIVIRATDLREHEVLPLPEPVHVDPGALTCHVILGGFPEPSSVSVHPGSYANLQPSAAQLAAVIRRKDAI